MLLMPMEVSAFSSNSTAASILPVHTINNKAIHKTHPAHRILRLVTLHGMFIYAVYNPISFI